MVLCTPKYNYLGTTVLLLAKGPLAVFYRERKLCDISSLRDEDVGTQTGVGKKKRG